MEIYSSWFNNQLSVWPKRVFSAAGSHEFFTKACPLEKTVKDRNDFLKAVNINEDASLLCKKGADALVRALKDSEYSHNIKKELSPLLFPDKKEITSCELENALKEAVNG